MARDKAASCSAQMGASSLHLWVYSQNITGIYTKYTSCGMDHTEWAKGTDQDVPMPTDTDMDSVSGPTRVTNGWIIWAAS